MVAHRAVKADQRVLVVAVHSVVACIVGAVDHIVVVRIAGMAAHRLLVVVAHRAVGHKVAAEVVQGAPGHRVAAGADWDRYTWVRPPNNIRFSLDKTGISRVSIARYFPVVPT